MKKIAVVFAGAILGCYRAQAESEFMPLALGNWWRFQRWEGMMIFQDTVTGSSGGGKFEMLRTTDIDTVPIKITYAPKKGLLFTWAQYEDFVMLPPDPKVGEAWVAYRHESLADRDGDGVQDTTRETVFARIVKREDVEVPAGKFAGALAVRYLTVDSVWLSVEGSWSADTAGDTLRYWVRGVGVVIIEEGKTPDRFVLIGYSLR